MSEYDDINRDKILRELVTDCFIAHQPEIIIRLLTQLEDEYIEIAKLATMGEYKATWTHRQVLDYITYET